MAAARYVFAIHCTLLEANGGAPARLECVVLKQKQNKLPAICLRAVQVGAAKIVQIDRRCGFAAAKLAEPDEVDADNEPTRRRPATAARKI